MRRVLINYPAQLRKNQFVPRQSLLFLQSLADAFARRGFRTIWTEHEVGSFEGVPGKDADYVIQYHELFANAVPGRWSCKVGPLSDWFWLDPLGYAKYAASGKVAMDMDAIDAGDAMQFVEALKQGSAQRNSSKFMQPDQRLIARPSGIVAFLPMQVPGDSVLRSEIQPAEHLAFLCAELRRQALSVRLMVKLHPMYQSDELLKLCKKMQVLHRIVVVNESIHSIFNTVDAVTCINSGVGIEALIQGLHVFTSADSEYAPAVSGLLRDPADFPHFFATLQQDVDRVR